jgi:hypothetical protein
VQRLVPASDIEDVVQETLCRVLASMGTTTVISLERYALEAARRVVKHNWRKRARTAARIQFIDDIDQFSAMPGTLRIGAREFLRRVVLPALRQSDRVRLGPKENALFSAMLVPGQHNIASLAVATRCARHRVRSMIENIAKKALAAGVVCSSSVSREDVSGASL